MLTRPGISQIAKLQRALAVALDDETRASSLLAALGQLSPDPMTLDKRDTSTSKVCACSRSLLACGWACGSAGRTRLARRRKGQWASRQ